MQLLTKEIERLGILNANNPGASLGSKKIAVKYFCPYGYATFFGFDYDPVDRVWFGYAACFRGCGEFGSFSLDELEEAKVTLAGIEVPAMERDLHFGNPTGSESKELERFMRENGSSLDILN